MDGAKKGISEVESNVVGNGVVKIVEMTRKVLEYYINLIDKAEF